MKNSRILFHGLTLVISLVLIVSCSDSEVDSPLSEQEERELAEVSSSHDALLDVELQAFDEFISEDEGGRLAAGCVTITRDQAAKTITLDFGNGCTGPFGRLRTGKIIVTYSGSFGDHLANRIVVFDNYSVNNRRISGTLELRDFNLDEAGNLTLSRRHTDLRITFSDGSHFTSSGSIHVTWISGFGDQDPSNNVFEITGSYEGVSSRGRKVSREIIEPLRVNAICIGEGGYGIVAGKVQTSIHGLNRHRVRLVDYGDGTCDNAFVVTVNGKVYNVSIESI